MNIKRRFWAILIVITLLSILAYVFLWMLTTPYELFSNDEARQKLILDAINKIIGRKTVQVGAMVISAILISSTTLVFQTMTNNRILTPSLIGFDAIFVTIQTAIIFFFTSTSILNMNPYLNFIVSSGLMILVSLTMYKVILNKNKNNIIFLLLVGMVLSTLSRSLSSFLQTIMDPVEFQSLVIRTEVSVANMNTSVIMLAIPLMVIIILLIIKEFRSYDVMILGETQAIGLGVEYTKKMNLSLIYIAIAMSITTAMIGPLAFLGLIAVNAAREMLKHYKHFPLFVASSLLSIIFLVLGQTIVVETGYLTTVTVLMSMVGGAYMIYLVLKENKV